MGPSNVENFSPQIIKQICKELLELTETPVEGIRVVYNDQDITNVQADIDGPPGTPYHGGAFRIRLVLGKSFPSAPPKGFFVTKIFHPNVGRNGEICVNTLKKDWKKDLGIKHILLTIKCLLIVPNPESALNEEAGMLLLEQYDDYFRRAKMITEIHAEKVITKPSDKRGNDNEPCSSSTMINNNTSSSNNNNTNSADAGIRPDTKSANGSQGQKHLRDDDGDDSSAADEPVSKKMNNILNNNSTPAEQQSQQQQQLQKASSQPKATGTSASNKNRGLKRVLRLRS